MLDWAAFIGRVRGMLARPAETLARDGRPAPGWRIAAREHVLPLLVLTGVVQVVLLILVYGSPGTDGLPQIGPVEALIAAGIRIMANFVALAVMAAIVAFYARLFGGSGRFDDSYVLLALSMTPLYLGEALMPLPWLGLLFALGGLIFALVIFYRGLAILLDIPPGNRVKHFALTLATMFVLSLLVTWLIIGPALIPDAPPPGV